MTKLLVLYYDNSDLLFLKEVKNTPGFEDITIKTHSLKEFGEGKREDNYDIAIALMRGISSDETIPSSDVEKLISWYGTTPVITWFLLMDDVEYIMEQIKEVNPKSMVCLGETGNEGVELKDAIK